MMWLNSISVVLLAAASVSPMLTSLHLYQMKEWRLDRLLDHLRSEGYIRQLFGTTRPTVLAIWAVAWLGLLTFGYGESESIWLLALGILLCAISCLQVMRRSQPFPVWTVKAISIAAITVIISLEIIIAGVFGPSIDVSLETWVIFAILVPFTQPFIAAFAWALLSPLDKLLKYRVMNRAKLIREAHPNLTVIGITGSVGKTTTKELVKHLLKGRDTKATPMHVNTEMGVAKWLTKTLENEPKESKKILIVEMGAYKKGEIALLCSICKPTIGILTFVGRQHLALFGSERNIAEAKGELLASLPKNGRGFVNADSPLIDVLKSLAASPLTLCGSGHGSDVSAVDIEETSTGIRFRAFETVFEAPLAGTHMVTNIMLAIGAAKELGMRNEEIQKSLKTFTAFERTFAVRKENGVTILDNTYNASPEGFQAAIEWASRQPNAEKILLCDGVIELGDDEARIHAEIAKRAAAVFKKVYVVHERFLPYFRPSFGSRATSALDHQETVPAGSLLVCIGRMPSSLVNRFVPKN